MTAQLIQLIADPTSRRCRHFLEEARVFGKRVELEVVSWREVIEHRGDLDQISELDRESIVRIDSIGESSELLRMLIEAGDESRDWRSIEHKQGQLIHPSLVYQGLKRVLGGLGKSFRSRPNLRPLACPGHIAEMFDKPFTSRQLKAAGLPCPAELDASTCRSGDDLMQIVKDSRLQTVYAKLSTGSSATGIAVIDSKTLSAQTSMVRIDGEVFNTLQLQTVSREQLIPLLDFLLREGLSLQEGIEKARINGMDSDVRIIMIDGQPEFSIFRLSQSPMTNLHFGGRRGNVDECLRQIPKRVWLDAMDTCVEVARQFDSHMIGIDLAFERGYFRHYILEVNAFGDFFPDLVDARGRTVYQAELESLLAST